MEKPTFSLQEMKSMLQNELNIKFYDLLSKTERDEIDDSHNMTGYCFIDAITTLSFSNGKEVDLFKITTMGYSWEYPPVTIYTLNLATMKPTQKSSKKTILSKELIDMIRQYYENGHSELLIKNFLT